MGSGPADGDASDSGNAAAAPRLILVVDDDDSLRQLLVKIFLKHGWATSECGDGDAALAVLERTPFDLVLLDKNLPGLDGIEVLRQLRARGDQVAVAIMTGYGTVENALETMELGIDAYFTKPFSSVVDLVQGCADIVDRRQRRTALRRGRTRAPSAAVGQRILVVSPVLATGDWVSFEVERMGGIVTRVADLAALVREAEDELADVALLDFAYGMTELAGAMEQLRALPWSPRPLVFGPTPTLEEAAALATAGATGFVPASFPFSTELRSALERLLGEHRPRDP